MNIPKHIGQSESGKKFILHEDAITQGFAILARRRSGKSVLAGVMEEEFLRRGDPFVVLDPVAAHWGIRYQVGPDGMPAAKSGFDVLIVGGEHGDVELDENAGAELAEVVVETDISVVIDLSMTGMGARKRFVTAFANRLYERNRTPRHIIVEEAHEFCLSSDTELLTERGWKKYTDVTTADIALCYNMGSGQYEYGPVERVIVREHKGEMVRLLSDGIDCLCTPDHRAVISRVQRATPRRYKIYPPAFCPADEIPTSVCVPFGEGPWDGEVEYLDGKICRLLGWVITDGFKTEKNAPYIAIEQSPNTVKGGKSMVSALDELVGSLGGKTRSIRKRGEHTVVRWYLGAALSRRLTSYLGDQIHRIPRDILEAGSRPQLQALYEGLMEGDGTADHNGWRFFYAGLSEGLADDVQELCVRLGISAVKKYVPQNRQWRVHISRRTKHWIRKPQREEYSGKVWDITVRTGAFVARRNGKAFVTGNCPQVLRFPEQIQVLGALERLIKGGGGRGLGFTLISQRPAAVNKDVLTQVDNVFVLRMSGPTDIKAISEWFEHNVGDKAQLKEILSTLPHLKPGDCWMMSPEWLQAITRMHVRQRVTYHAGRTPKRGETAVDVKKFGVSEVVDKFKAIILEKNAAKLAESEEKASLQARVRDLESQLATVNTGPTRREVEFEIERVKMAREQAYLQGKREGYENGIKSGQQIIADTSRALALAFKEIETNVGACIQLTEGMVEKAERIEVPAVTIDDSKLALMLTEGDTEERFSDNHGSFRPVGGYRTAAEQRELEEEARHNPVPSRHNLPVAPVSRPRGTVEASSNGNSVTPAQTRVLRAIAMWNAIGTPAPTRIQVAFLAGSSPTSSGYRNNVYRLNTLGLICYPSNGTLALTAEGKAKTGTVPALSQRAVIEAVRQQLTPAQIRILDPLTRAYPKALTRESLADLSSQSAASSGYRNNIYFLSARNIVTYPSTGEVRVSDWIMGRR